MDLFTELDLPAVLYLPETHTGWVRTMHARWADLQASMAVREQSIADLHDETAKFEDALVALGPVMKDNPMMNVAQALEILEGQR